MGHGMNSYGIRYHCSSGQLNFAHALDCKDKEGG